MRMHDLRGAVSAPQGDPEIELWAVACAVLVVGAFVALFVYVFL